MKKLLLVALIVGLTGSGWVSLARADEAIQSEGLKARDQLDARIKAASEARVRAHKAAMDALKGSKKTEDQKDAQGMKVRDGGRGKAVTPAQAKPGSNGKELGKTQPGVLEKE